MWNKSLLDAIEVGKILNFNLPKRVVQHTIFGNASNEIIEGWYHIQAFQNGREQGITLWVPYLRGQEGFTFYISHNRSTDKIGYYLGKHTFQGCSKDAYEKGFVSFESIQECANDISCIILDLL